MSKAVVLCSGGLNSAVVAALAQRLQPVALLHVSFPHRATKRERAAFEAIALSLSVERRLAVEMPHLAQVGGGPRVETRRPIPSVEGEAGRGVDVQPCGLMFGLIAAGYSFARQIGAPKLIIGLSELTDSGAGSRSAGGSEFTREFIMATSHMLGVASSSSPVELETPLLELRRSEIIRLGRQLGVPFDQTWSCIASDEGPCGACIGCVSRSRGFLEAEIPERRAEPAASGNMPRFGVPRPPAPAYPTAAV